VIAERVGQDESDIIISGALRRPTVSGSNVIKMLIIGESNANAKEQYKDHSISIRYSDSFPLAGL
jgi:hypothetical protein